VFRISLFLLQITNDLTVENFNSSVALPVIMTADVQRYIDSFNSWLQPDNKQPFIVVGPEGCGKGYVILKACVSLSLSVCVCVCVRERERERETDLIAFYGITVPGVLILIVADISNLINFTVITFRMLLRHCFEQLRSTQTAVVYCSAQTNPSHVLQKLSQTCMVISTNTGRVYRPKDCERLILYLKDLNLPKPDKWGTSQLIAFLQQVSVQNIAFV